MKGSVLHFEAGNGVITTEDGSRYEFSIPHWKGDEVPSSGMAVDFVPTNNHATEIYQVNAPAVVNNQTQPYPQGVTRTSGLAIASLVLSILLFSVIAVVLGHMALSEIEKSKGSIEGKGLALTGLIFGYIQIAFTVIFIITIFGVLASV